MIWMKNPRIDPIFFEYRADEHTEPLQMSRAIAMQYEFDDFILKRIARFLSPVALRQMRRTCRRMRALFDPRTFARARILYQYPVYDMMAEAALARDIPLCEHLFATQSDERYYIEQVAAVVSARMVASDESYWHICKWCVSKNRGCVVFDGFARGCIEGHPCGVSGGLKCIGAYRELLRSLRLSPDAPLYDPFGRMCLNLLVHAIRLNNIALFRRFRKRVNWGSFDPIEYKICLIEQAIRYMSAANAIIVFMSLVRLAEQAIFHTYSMDRRILDELKQTKVDREEKHAFFARYFGWAKVD